MFLVVNFIILHFFYFCYAGSVPSKIWASAKFPKPV